MIFTELLLQKLAGPNLAEWLAPLVIGLFYVTLSSLLMRDLCPGDCRVACYGPPSVFGWFRRTPIVTP